MGAEPPGRWGIFRNFLEKKGYLMRFESHFATFSEPFETTKFLMFESQLNKSLPLLHVKSKTRFKILHFGIKFCDLAQVKELRYLLSANILACNNALEDLRLTIFVLSWK